MSGYYTIRLEINQNSEISINCSNWKECAGFFDDAVLRGDSAKAYDGDEILRCSRHLARQTSPQTPENYWELSFIDEKKDR